MKLHEWRKQAGLSFRAAAEHISRESGASITHEHIRRLEAGTQSPTIATADLIRRGTGGAVTRMDWPEEAPT